MLLFKHIVVNIRVRHILLDLLLMTLSLLLSLYLRLGEIPKISEYTSALLILTPIVLGIRLTVFLALDVYSILWRYISANDTVRLAKAILLSSAIVIVVAFLFPSLGRLPRSVYFIDAAVLMVLLMGMRITRRLFYERETKDALSSTGGKTRLLIIGAGNNGRFLAQQLRTDSSLQVEVAGFLDDDRAKMGKSIVGYRVLGKLADLGDILAKHRIKQVMIAIPNLPSPKLREIFSTTRRANISPKILAAHKASGQPNSVELARDINLGDLLSRPQRNVDVTSIRNMIRGQKVLVTGAGGSIGSELARQILSHEPSRLLLLDHSELNLYNIDRELRIATHDVAQTVPLLIDIKDKAALEHSLRHYAPDIIFHAAAYKHVHLAETNPYSTIVNNVQGTKNLLDVAVELDVKHFVNISTDKAVNPAGIMGATKRVCEILMTLAAKKTGRPYCSVRFGNVLGSSGSLIPTLKEQIRQGGPVTITHKDMTRFFMLIPEAVGLVLKAATIAQPGDINVLKMGEPVKILEIAKSLISLMGKSEDQIPIVFTGLRPGEKMFEELYIRGDELVSEHPDILVIPDGDLDLQTIQNANQQLNLIGQILDYSARSDKQALYLLNQIVNSNYRPTKQEDIDGCEVIESFLRFQRQ